MRVNEIMSSHVKTVPVTASADAAWQMMRGDRIHHLVVMDGKKVAHAIGSVVVLDKGKPVGIVTTSHLLEWLGRGAIRPTPFAKRATLNYRAPHTKRPREFGVW